jgi:hypothetical protein
MFEKINQKEIQEFAEKINNILFNPKLRTPIKTLDIPIGGKQSSATALPLILDFVTIANNIKSNENIDDDFTGDKTIQLLKQTLKIAQLVNSSHSSSLGLHPAIYFYSKEGRYKPGLFYGIIKFIFELKIKKKINDFIDTRVAIENIIWNYDYLMQQIHRKYRGAQKSYPYVADFLLESVILLKSGLNEKEVIDKLIENNFKYLTIEKKLEETEKKDFSTNKKSAVYIKDAIESAPKCKICNGLIHTNSISIDHKERKQDGGLGKVENGQITHPYCNTGYKN